MTMPAPIKEKHLIRWLTFSEASCIIIMVRHGGAQADMVLERELRVLHLDPQILGGRLSVPLSEA